MCTGLRIEWCKGRARKDRWKEEVQLLQEEMERVKKSLLYEANLWDQRAKDTDNWSLPGLICCPAYSEGRVAYAHEQHQQFLGMHRRCEEVWINADSFIANNGRIEVIPSIVIHDDEEVV